MEVETVEVDSGTASSVVVDSVSVVRGSSLDSEKSVIISSTLTVSVLDASVTAVLCIDTVVISIGADVVVVVYEAGLVVVVVFFFFFVVTIVVVVVVVTGCVVVVVVFLFLVVGASESVPEDVDISGGADVVVSAVIVVVVVVVFTFFVVAVLVVGVVVVDDALRDLLNNGGICFLSPIDSGGVMSYIGSEECVIARL